jgi:hypothetical protein
MSENRTPPFCCHRILPQAPLHKHENYPRAYACVLDFLQLATRFPNYPPQTTLSKTLQQHDFVIRLCKGQVDPHYRPNQWGPARYFLHDPDIHGCLVEIVDSPNGDRSSSLETLKFLLHEREGSFGGFLFLEDVWMTVRCPVHSDTIWFLQFWTKGPRDSGHLEQVSKRVRCRLGKEPGFVEDPFTIRFNEMMGIPNLEVQQERESRERYNMSDVAYGVNTGGKVGKFGDEQEVDPSQRFEAQREALVRFSPGLRPPPSSGPPPSIPSGLALSSFLRQQNLFGNNKQNASNFHPGNWTLNHGLDHPELGGVFLPQRSIETTVHQPTIMNEVYARGTKQGFLGTALQREDPALRAGFTPHLPNLAPPLSLSTSHDDTQQLHSLQPSRSFNVANMWRGSPHSVQPIFPHQHVPVLERVPSGAYQPESRLQPQQLVSQDDGWEDISQQIVPRKSRLPQSKLSPPDGPLRDSRPSPRPTGVTLPVVGEMSKTLKSVTPTQEPTQAARLRDMNVSDASAYTPPAGNTSGLRPVERRAWDDANKQWKSYWVWAL